MQTGFTLADVSIKQSGAAVNTISDEALIQSIANGNKQALKVHILRVFELSLDDEMGPIGVIRVLLGKHGR